MSVVSHQERVPFSADQTQNSFLRLLMEEWGDQFEQGWNSNEGKNKLFVESLNGWQVCFDAWVEIGDLIPAEAKKGELTVYIIPDEYSDGFTYFANKKEEIEEFLKDHNIKDCQIFKNEKVEQYY